MTRYRFTVEFDSKENPGKWDWTELVSIDDEYTETDWSTWNVEEVK